MSDTDEKIQGNEPEVKSGGSLKLSLNKSVDSNRLKAGLAANRSKTVTVEVRKDRSARRAAAESPKPVSPEASRAISQLRIKPNVQPKEIVISQTPPSVVEEEQILTDSERSARIKAFQKSLDGGEKMQTSIRSSTPLRRIEVDTDRPDISKDATLISPLLTPSKPDADPDKWKVKSKRGKEDEETDEEIAARKLKKKAELAEKWERGGKAVELDDSAFLDNPDTSEALLSTLKSTLEDEEELEDYSDDEADNSESIVAVTKNISSETSGMVQKLKSAARVIVAPADPEKMKRNLRSEAASTTVRNKVRLDEMRKNSVRQILSQSIDNAEERAKSLANARKLRDKARKKQGRNFRDVEKILRTVIIPDNITVQDLASRMSEKSGAVVKTLFKMGMTVTANETIDADTAELVVTELGHTPIRQLEADIETALNQSGDDESSLTNRPPVVTIMGHVDHGKTTLLDSLRVTDVAAGEAGGITQHIGAYQVRLKSGHRITFLDTPGHEAFTAMRARGAKVTDIVVLVVAADDGIKEQTVEAINHAKAAGVPIIVAVNKIDKPGADSSRVKNELFTYELVPEDFGGDVMCVEVSAKQKLNLEKLTDAIILQSEVLDLKANPKVPAAGIVIEAKVDKGRGVVATVLVQHGTLRQGDIVLAGSSYGRARTLTDDAGNNLSEAGPSMAVEVLGLNNVPMAGDNFNAVESEKQAREVADYRERKLKEKQAAAAGKSALEQFLSTAIDNVQQKKELAVIVKGDVQGSVEAINGSLSKVGNEEASIRVLHTGVGGITESDVALASASNAIIVGFNVRANAQAKDLAEKNGIQLRYYSIIYNLVDDMKEALTGILTPKKTEKFIGYVEIRKVYEISKIGKISGCMVTQGLVKRGSKVRILRDSVVIHEGWLKTLKRFKDEVKEVREGFECGMSFDNFDDIREGDIVEVSEIEETAATL